MANFKAKILFFLQCVCVCLCFNWHFSLMSKFTQVNWVGHVNVLTPKILLPSGKLYEWHLRDDIINQKGCSKAVRMCEASYLKLMCCNIGAKSVAILIQLLFLLLLKFGPFLNSINFPVLRNALKKSRKAERHAKKGVCDCVVSVEWVYM